MLYNPILSQQELRDIFRFIDDSFPNRLDGATKALFLYACVPCSDEFMLSEILSEIQNKILQLYRRYCVYGFGEIMVVNNGSRRPIFPKIRMTIPIWKPIIDLEKHGIFMYILSFTGRAPPSVAQMKLESSTWLTPMKGTESLRVDLNLIKALLEDARSMRVLDERLKVWLDQMQEISADLESQLVENNVTPSSRTLRRIRHNMRDIGARKITYGIGSALGEGSSMLHSIAAISYEHPSPPPSVETFAAAVDTFLEEDISKAAVSGQVKSLRAELQLMQALVEDSKRTRKPDARLKCWLDQMQGIAREANTVMELDTRSLWGRIQATLRINRIRDQILTMSKWKHTLDIDIRSRKHAGVLGHNSETLEATNDALDLIRSGMNLIKALDSDIGEMDELDGVSEAWVEEMRKIASDAEAGLHKSSVIDRIRQLSEIRIAYGIQIRPRLPANVVSQIKDRLVADDEHSCIVPILGTTSSKKEALRDVIYQDSTIMQRFELHAWATATSISEHIAFQIVEQLRTQLPEEEANSLFGRLMDNDAAMAHLQDVLLQKRCLIVLEEIQSGDVWRCLEPCFQPISSSSSRVIILTRDEQTRTLLDSTSDAIDVRLGWDARSTDNHETVPAYLRQCLYYFLLFPAGFEVPARRLIVLWVAEGLVYPKKNQSDSAERVAYNYLEELVKSGNVLVAKEKANGEVKACKLAQGTRETWLDMARAAGFFHDSGAISRLVDHHGGSDPWFIQIDGTQNFAATRNYQSVISLLSFNTREGSKPGEDIGDFLRKCISARFFKWMRVLDLERVFRPKLPNALRELTLLRYLGLRWTYLEHLPKYVSKFLNLHVLDVKHTYISTLPESIWRMQYLRHLYLSEVYRTRFPRRPSRSLSLTALQTLWGAFIDEDPCVEDGLDTLHDIRKLGLSCRPSSSSANSRMAQHLKAVDAWISTLTSLESLRLKSEDENGKPAELHLSSLEKNTKRYTVYLMGKLNPCVIVGNKLPQSLTDVTLSGSELNVDPMEFLGQLQHLQILRLLGQSVVCNKIVCSENSFPKLKVLKLWKLEKLDEWEAEDGSLLSLEKLEIRSCDKLENLPDELLQVQKLKITLTKVTKKFMEVIVGKQPALWAKVEHFSEAN